MRIFEVSGCLRKASQIARPDQPETLFLCEKKRILLRITEYGIYGIRISDIGYRKSDIGSLPDVGYRLSPGPGLLPAGCPAVGLLGGFVYGIRNCCGIRISDISRSAAGLCPISDIGFLPAPVYSARDVSPNFCGGVAGWRACGMRKI